MALSPRNRNPIEYTSFPWAETYIEKFRIDSCPTIFSGRKDRRMEKMSEFLDGQKYSMRLVWQEMRCKSPTRIDGSSYPNGERERWVKCDWEKRNKLTSIILYVHVCGFCETSGISHEPDLHECVMRIEESERIRSYKRTQVSIKKVNMLYESINTSNRWSGERYWQIRHIRFTFEK
jgi:hypothetical protein